MPDARHAALLTLNAGSSSIRFAVFESESLAPWLEGKVEGLGTESASTTSSSAHPARFSARNRRLEGKGETERSTGAGRSTESGPLQHSGRVDHAVALKRIIEWIRAQPVVPQIVGVGHRVVHGGAQFSAPVVLDDHSVAALRALIPLAPLHQPHNLAGIEAARAAFPSVPQIACFDTAFHRNQPFVNDCFALPRRFYDEGIRRYGFHGISYEYIAERLRALYPMHAAGRVIVAHLGNGASMCAMLDGHSIASTMGFTALDGLPMGTRCGQVDPGVLLYLMDERKMDAAGISSLLYKESGLLGLSGGLSNDMRTLEASTDPHAGDAIDYFVFRIRREIGGLAAALEGLDALVFTGGIGENSVLVRQRAMQGLEWLGLELDEARNRANGTVLSTDRSRVLALRLPTDEEGMIARHLKQAVGG